MEHKEDNFDIRNLIQEKIDKIREIGHKMGKTDEEIDRDIAIGRKMAFRGMYDGPMIM